MAETMRCDAFEVWVFPPNTIEHVVNVDDELLAFFNVKFFWNGVNK